MPLARILLAIVLLGVGGAAAAGPPAIPSAGWLIDHVRLLSAPDNEGRAAGGPGADRAAAHIAAAFAGAGLRPGGDGGEWFQPFDVPTGVRLGERNSLEMTAPAPTIFALGQDFTPLPVSEDGLGEAELVFAGYGITAPQLGWDDYQGVDVSGKVVLVLGGEPRREDPASPFRRPDAYHYSERSHKIINAREHGARAVLLVSHPAAASDVLPAMQGLAQPAGILAAYLTRRAGDALLAPAGHGLAGLSAAIDQAMAPRPRSIPGTRVRLGVSLVRERAATRNVIGILPGTDATLRDQAVLVGAHYDHLGRGGEGSLAPEQVGTVHPGADDNASGTAAVIALARAFAAAGGAPRTLVFAAFSGEEMGLLGSARYAAHPAHPLASTVLMVNLDMVGHLRERRLYVSGVDSGSGLRALVSAAAGPLTLELRGDPFARSDHTTFYSAGRPVLFLFTGAHPDYHRPGDTWDKINADGLAEVTAFAARVIAAVAAQPGPPVYARVEGAPAAAGGRGYGPFFGAVPEFGQTAGEGMRVGGVRPGSPADQAGLARGDVIVGFGGVRVRTLEDFAFALRGHRAGDRVAITVIREGTERRLEAVLEERR